MEARKLKVGIFVDAFFPMIDGVIIVVDNYAKKMLEFADVTVFCPQARDPKYIDQTAYKVVRSKKIMIPFTDYDYSIPFLDAKFHKILHQSNLDIVHIHSPFSLGKIGLAYAKKYHIPCVATLHSQYKMDFEQRVKNTNLTSIMIKNIMKVFNNCDEMHAVNQQIAQIFIDYGALYIPKVINNGTDLLPMPYDDTLINLRQEYKIHEQSVFLFVGRIDIIKNIFFIIEAMKTVKASQLPFKMFFIGSGPDEDKLKKVIKEAGLSHQIVMVGRIINRNRLARFYQLADLFIFPSLYDASSLVQIEAASQKTPSIFIKGATTAGQIIDHVNGFLADNDPVLYGESIISICKNDALLNKVSENAYRDLYRTWDEQVQKTIKTYRKLIDKYRN